MQIEIPIIITTYKEWIESFLNNNNPGTSYEICVGLSILRGNHLSKNEVMPSLYQHVTPCNKFKNIKGIINLTQKDDVGGTGDIGIVSKDGNIRYYSVTQWKKKPTKCICNPSGANYGISRTIETEQKNDEAYKLALDFRKNNKGEIPNQKWKRVSKCPGSKLMAEFLAEEASNSWMKMSEYKRKEALLKFIDSGKKKNNIITTNTDGIIYWDSKKNIIAVIYKWTININIDDHLTTFNDGIYICHGTRENVILKTQAKYNNGIIEGISSKILPEKWEPIKSSNYISSWDCVAPDLNKIFKLEKI